MFDVKISISKQLGGAFVQTFLLAIFGLILSSGLTYAAPPNTMPVWRVQVRFETDIYSNDAGSDDYVKVELNAANRTWLESDQDDFAPYLPHTYDLRMEGINTLSDIDYFRIEKTGSDGWCIRRMYLIVNGVTIFYRYFPNGLWLDNSGGHSRIFFIDDYFMRTESAWVNYTVPTRPSTISANEMRYRIEAIVGDFVALDHFSGEESSLMMARDGASGTEIYTYNSNTWRGDLDLEADGTFFNMNIDVDFDLRVSCLNGRPNFSTSNVRASSTFDWNSTTRARNYTVNYLAPRLNEMMKNFTFPSCSRVSFTLSPYGDLKFVATDFQFPDIGIIVKGFSAQENDKPLNLRVFSEKKFKPNQETYFTASVKNDLTEDADGEISFQLPAQALILTPVVEVFDGEVNRSLVVQDIVREADGRSLIKLRDRLPAGKNLEYTLRLLFQPVENQTGKIITTAEFVNLKADVSETRTQAETVFDFKSDEISTRETMPQNPDGKRAKTMN